MRILDERDWLVKLLTAQRVKITDTGFDFTEDRGEIVYECETGRFEITIKEMK